MKRRHKIIVLLAAGATAIAPLQPAEAATFGKPIATYFGNTAVFGPLVNALCSGLVTLTNAAGTPINTTNGTAVTKTVTRSDNANGSSDFMVVIAGAIPATFTTIDVLDCVWIDSNNDGVQQLLVEPMRSYRALSVPIDGTGANRTVTFELNVPNAVGKPVCDRAFGVSWSAMQNLLSNPSGIATGSWLALYTPKACSSAALPPDVPEVGLSVLLTLTGVGTAAAVLVLQRRHRLRAWRH
jgi:hypothetical protein